MNCANDSIVVSVSGIKLGVINISIDFIFIAELGRCMYWVATSCFK